MSTIAEPLFADDTPRYKQLRDRLLQEIITAFQPGDRFHTQRDLMKQYGLGYATVDKALQLLKAEGFLVREQGRGSFVARPPMANTRTVGVLVPRLHDFFYMEMIEGALEEAQKHHFDLLLADTLNSPLLEESRFSVLLSQKKVSGFLLCPTDHSISSPILQRVQAAQIPCVLLGSIDPSSRTPFDYVNTDAELGAQLATQRLLDQGCRNIAFVSLDRVDDPRVKVRRAGYLKALRESNVAERPDLWIKVSNMEASGGEEAGRLLAARVGQFDGVFATNDYLAIGILLRLRLKGVNVGQEVKIVGFDDIDAASWPGIGLTTVVQSRTEIGRRAMNLLIQRCIGLTPEASQITLPPNLVIRTSG